MLSRRPRVGQPSYAPLATDAQMHRCSCLPHGCAAAAQLFCLFCALPGDAFCKCTSEFTRRRAAHSELLSLCFEQTQTQPRLSSSALASAEASEACGIFSCCFVSTVSSVSLAR